MVGAEGATSPESLRLMDRRGRALWRAGPIVLGLTEGVNRRGAGDTLRFHDRAGLAVRCRSVGYVLCLSEVTSGIWPERTARVDTAHRTS